MSSDQYRNRSTRVENHYRQTYGDRYDYYRSQPPIYVGNYSPLFWYAVLDWSLERRAMWFYHNQHLAAQNQAFAAQMQNAQLQAEIARLKANGVQQNPNYVDTEFSQNPDLMYNDDFVRAAYNPAPAVSHSSGVVWIFFWILFWVFVCMFVCIIGVRLVVWLVLDKNWK